MTTFFDELKEIDRLLAVANRKVDDHMIIEPTVGRVVWYRDVPNDLPRAAIVAKVHTDRNVNLHVINPDSAQPYGMVSVQLRQPEDEEPASRYCEWTPYQVGQAKKVTDEIAELMKIVEQQALRIDELNERVLALEPQTTPEAMARLEAETSRTERKPT